MIPLVRPMRPADVDEADRVMRLAFGTQFGLAEPSSFRGDGELVRLRFAADPEAAFVAELDGRIVGSVIAMRWGSVGVLGPLSVHPELWSGGLGRHLMPPVIALFERDGVRLAGLYTFPQSPKHVRLYESFGFELQAVTAIMARTLADERADRPLPEDAPFGALGEAGRKAALAGCREVSESVFPGLDLAREIETVEARRLGEVVLLREGGAVRGFAVCHAGAGSEAGSGTLYVKFAAVMRGTEAPARLAALLESCEALAARLGARRVVAGVNTARRGAYRLLRSRGYRADMAGVAMHRPDQPGYNRAEIFALDDWR